MAITIQELLASDTISQAVDKINFNFDQLLLNGGGPLGPAGPAGPSGPIGGRGERGTEWYEGTDDPNVTPPTLTPLTADYYLQSNGDVWEYTGLSWTNTGINLTGPQGATGSSGGWSFFGNAPYGTYAATSQNVGYPALMPPGSNTINVNNQGVRTFSIGIAGPNDNPAYGFPVDSAYKISNTLAGLLDASVVSALIHQKNSGSSALKFMGGGAIPGENFEQDDLSSLSHISLGTDDTLNINVPKEATTPTTADDVIGFNIFTEKRGQNFRSGGGISFSTGNKTGGSISSFDNSDFSITLNELVPLGSSALPQFKFNSIGNNSQAQLLMGGGITFPNTPDPIFDGEILAQARKIRVLSSSELFLTSTSDTKLSSGTNEIRVQQGSIAVNSNVGNIDITSNAGTIGISSPNAVSIISNDNLIRTNNNNAFIRVRNTGFADRIDIKTSASLGEIEILADQAPVKIKSTSSYIELRGAGFATDAPVIKMDAVSGQRHTLFQGRQQYKIDGSVPTPATTQLNQQYILLNTDDLVAGETLQYFRNANSSNTDTASGVMMSRYFDGDDTVIIGKPRYPVGSERGGIFINTGGTSNSQFHDAALAAVEMPSNERFRVDRELTKISNKLIMGGHNGFNDYFIDPLFMSNTPASNLFITKPYLKITVGVFSNVTAGNIGSLNSNMTNYNFPFKLTFSDELRQKGQRVYIEVYQASARFAFTTSGQSTLRACAGRVSLSYEAFERDGSIVTKDAPDAVVPAVVVGTSTTTAKHTRYIYEFQFSPDGERNFYCGNGTGNVSAIPVSSGWMLTNVHTGFFTGGGVPVDTMDVTYDYVAPPGPNPNLPTI